MTTETVTIPESRFFQLLRSETELASLKCQQITDPQETEMTDKEMLDFLDSEPGWQLQKTSYDLMIEAKTLNLRCPNVRQNTIRETLKQFFNHQWRSRNKPSQSCNP